MAVRKILVWPHPTLSTKSQSVDAVDDKIRALVADMIATMDDHGHSAGIAAPQVGELLRIFIADVPPEHNDGNGTDGPEVFINPVIIHREGEFEWEEACLSIPGLSGKITRSENIVMQYLDINGKQVQKSAFGYLSGCLQHELDHLDGILWVDHQPKLTQDIVRRKMKKYKLRAAQELDQN